MSIAFYEIASASLLGLGTTSSSIFGAAIGLYMRFSERILACILAFAAGALISALAIELGYEGAETLHHLGFAPASAWLFVSAGFAVGAVIYYGASIFLEGKGAAVRYASQFREYALVRKKHASQDRIQLLAKCDLLRQLPPEAIEEILPCIKTSHRRAGEILFYAGDDGDALYIVAAGKVAILGYTASGAAGRPIKVQVLPGGTAQTATSRDAKAGSGNGNGSIGAANGSARNRAEHDPVVRRMREKFGAEIRTVIDYREKR